MITNTPKRRDLYFFEAKPIFGVTTAILNDKLTVAKLCNTRLCHIRGQNFKYLQIKGFFIKNNFGEYNSWEQYVVHKQAKLPFSA